MSQPNFDLAGKNLKEWSFIILMITIAISIAVFTIAFGYAMMNTPEIIVSGTIDMGQFTGVIIGISIVAVTLVAQQLTSKQQAAAVANTDAVWAAEN